MQYNEAYKWLIYNLTPEKAKYIGFDIKDSQEHYFCYISYHYSPWARTIRFQHHDFRGYIMSHEYKIEKFSNGKWIEVNMNINDLKSFLKFYFADENWYFILEPILLYNPINICEKRIEETKIRTKTEYLDNNGKPITPDTYLKFEIEKNPDTNETYYDYGYPEIYESKKFAIPFDYCGTRIYHELQKGVNKNVWVT